MKTEKKVLEKCQVQLDVTLDAAEIGVIVKDVEKTFMREARLPGFRPGKVPVDVIRREFAPQLEREVKTQIFSRKYAEAVKAEALDEVAPAEVEDLKYNAEGASFTVRVDVKPVFKIPTYKGLKIAPAKTEVSEEEVQGQLSHLRANYAKYENAKEGEAIAAGDFAQIDYSGTVGGKPILEVAPEAKMVAGGTGFWTQLEEGRFLPEILDALDGMKAGETKEKITVKFNKEAAPEGLKGEKAVYRVTLKAFRRRILPTDAELVERMKAESFEKLVADLRKSMEDYRIEEEKVRRQNEALDLLLKKADFDVPGTQVARTTDRLLEQYADRAQKSGIDASYFEQNAEKIKKDAEENAERQVRLWYIIDAIAAAEKIEAKDNERIEKVLEFVLANAKK